jgi:cytoskeletal protein CcmA (bactofilin family)
MWETAESKVTAQKPAGGPPPAGHATGLGAAMEQATLGATMIVKGELSGSQAFFVDGRVEGKIRFPEHRVTIGRGAVVLATIEAKEVVIMGTVTGNIDCSDRVDIRGDAVLTGDVLTQRISIDEGALVKGSVEVRKVRKSDHAETESQTVASTKPVEAEAAPSMAAAAAAPATRPLSTVRVSGSKVLFQESKG